LLFFTFSVRLASVGSAKSPAKQETHIAAKSRGATGKQASRFATGAFILVYYGKLTRLLARKTQ